MKPDGIVQGLKQRLLSFWWRRAYYGNYGDPSARAAALRHLYFHFDQLKDLLLCKVQFLDEAHLLVKMGSVDVLAANKSNSIESASSHGALFVVYNVNSTMVVGAYENTSRELLDLFEHFCDYFRVSSFSKPLSYISSCGNNAFGRDTLRKLQYAVKHARNGGSAQAVRRVLLSLPFSTQGSMESPYFDMSLFAYDGKVICPVDRPQLCCEYPIKFYSRLTGALKFKIDPGAPHRSQKNSKRYSSYICHPRYPLIISIHHQFRRPTQCHFHVVAPLVDDEQK